MRPRIETDESIVASFLSDAAHVQGGFAAGVAFPQSVDEVADLVRNASTVLPVGAQSSLTGGATPQGELVLSTRALMELAIDVEGRQAIVGAGVPLRTLQTALASHGLWYPPVPTYDGAFVGGTLATNAAGAATFKYGSTRDWVEAVTVVLSGGQVVQVRRGETVAADGALMVRGAGTVVRVPVPTYAMPDVRKLSAGYFARSDMDLVDLFIGTEGTLGVIVEATLRVIPKPRQATALIRCESDAQAVAATSVLRERALEAWRGRDPLDVSAIEFMDARSLSFAGPPALTRAAVTLPAPGGSLLLVQFETGPDSAEALDALGEALDGLAVHADPVVALPGDAATAARLFELREAVPAGVNAAIAAARVVDPSVQKTAGDFIVPFPRLGDSVELYRRVFESRGLEYAVWGHMSDGNLHPNGVPRSALEMARGREALREAAGEVIRMGGSPLAEHGVGRSPMKQAWLMELYGRDGIEAMRAVKRALDPEWKLAPGVLFGRQA